MRRVMRCVRATCTVVAKWQRTAKLRTAWKKVKKGLPGARGRVSWDPVVADPPVRGVQSQPALQGTGVSGVRQARSRAKRSTVCVNTGC